MKKVISLLLMLMLIVGTFVGCGGNGGGGGGGEDGAGTGLVGGGRDFSDQEYVYLTIVSHVPYWTDTKMGLESAARFLGVRTTFMGPPDANIAEQIRMMDDLIARRPAGIIVFAADPAINDSINRARAAGINVITDNSDAPDSDRLSWTGFDGYNMGRVGGRKMVELLGGEGRVLIGGFPSANVQERIRGYISVFDEYPGIEVVAVLNDEADPVRAPEIYTQALIAHPNIDGIVGTNGDSGRGIALALTELGLAGQVRVIAMDRNDDMLPFIVDGVIDATVVDKAYMNAFLGVNMLFWLYNDIVNPVDGWRDHGINILPERVDSSVMIVTRENVDQFLR